MSYDQVPMELESYFKGLADRNRLRIINLLTVEELCGCDIQYVSQGVAVECLTAPYVFEEVRPNDG